MIFYTNKQVVVEPTRGLYKWAKIFNRLQRNFFDEDFILRREKQIKDFAFLNGFTKIHYIKDTDVFNLEINYSIEDANLIVITDQKFSRYSCKNLIQELNKLLRFSPVYVCLNRHYLNIDNSFNDNSLDDNFNRAITQWISNSLPEYNVVDLSLDYLDCGNAFTWAIPDRHYYINLKHAQVN